MTDLSIIIVSYKGWNRLTKCLESLSSFTGGSFLTEVVIVDNRSDDETILSLEKQYPEFRFIHNKINGGFANGCNLGARNSKGEFLLFLNPDTVASESEIGKLLAMAKRIEVDTILSCRQVNDNGKESIASGPFPHFFNLTGIQRAIIRLIKSDNNRVDTDTETDVQFPDWVSGSVIMMKRDIFDRLKGFDEDFWMYFEDVDLCKRAHETGINVRFLNNITIEHNHGGSSRTSLKTMALTKTEVNISRHVYISKHKSGIEKMLIHTFLVVNNLITGFLMALIGLLFFFIPRLFLRTLIYLRLMNYYILSLSRRSWISKRSVNFPCKLTKDNY